MNFAGLTNNEKRIEQINKITKEDVISLARKVSINTVYLLEGTETDEEN